MNKTFKICITRAEHTSTAIIYRDDELVGGLTALNTTRTEAWMCSSTLSVIVMAGGSVEDFLASWQSRVTKDMRSGE